MATLQIRVKDDTKKQARKILDRLGMDMSSAVTVFLHQVIIQKGLPFKILTQNGFTPEFEEAVLLASAETDESPEFTHAKDAIAYLRKKPLPKKKA